MRTSTKRSNAVPHPWEAVQAHLVDGCGLCSGSDPWICGKACPPGKWLVNLPMDVNGGDHGESEGPVIQKKVLGGDDGE